MGFANLLEKKTNTTQNTNIVETNNILENEQVTGSEGSIVARGNINIVNDTSDPELAALIASKAYGFAETQAMIDERKYSKMLDSGFDTQKLYQGGINEVVNKAIDALSNKTTEMINSSNAQTDRAISAVERNALGESPTIAESSKYVIFGTIGIVVILGGLYIYGKYKRN